MVENGAQENPFRFLINKFEKFKLSQKFCISLMNTSDSEFDKLKEFGELCAQVGEAVYCPFGIL